MRLPAIFRVLETLRREVEHCPPGEDIHHGVPERSCPQPASVGFLTEGVFHAQPADVDFLMEVENGWFSVVEKFVTVKTRN